MSNRKYVRPSSQQGSHLARLQLLESCRDPTGSQSCHGVESHPKRRHGRYPGQLHQPGPYPDAHGAQELWGSPWAAREMGVWEYEYVFPVTSAFTWKHWLTRACSGPSSWDHRIQGGSALPTKQGQQLHDGQQYRYWWRTYIVVKNHLHSFIPPILSLDFCGCHWIILAITVLEFGVLDSSEELFGIFGGASHFLWRNQAGGNSNRLGFT